MIDVDWGDVDETILVWTFEDGWTAQDFMDAFTTSEEFVEEKTTPSIVHALLDVQHTVHLPNDMFTLGRYAINRASNLEFKGLITIINPTMLWVRFYDALKVTAPHAFDVRFAQDADEAYKMMVDSNALLLLN
jgi:hypothetical protein